MWGTRFWNQTYTDWEQVHAPRHTIHDTTNPHQQLDYIRFVSDSVLRFCEMQASILRKYIKPGDFVTTNGMFEHMDNHRMVENSLDVYTYDSYPNFAYMLDAKNVSPLKDRGYSQALAQVRSICPHFGIMEQQSGPGGWVSRMRQPAPKPGQMRLWAWQSIAHGADFVSFFRWRTATMGTEIYWHGILNYDNEPNRRLREVATLAGETARLSDLPGTRYRARIAMVKDYSNEWDSRLDNWRRQDRISDYGWYEASQVCHAPMDFVYLPEEDSGYTVTLEDLLAYDLLIYPHPSILTKERAALLRQYAEKGGTLILLIEARVGGGPAVYFDWISDLQAGTMEKRLRERFTVPGYIFLLNCEQAHRYNILMLSSVPAETVAPMGLKAYSDVDSLMAAANLAGKTIYVIPNGGTVVPHVTGGDTK